ncbi:MAG: OmpA family protein [Thermodesulfobacteriota bacterium]|nr:OmpA family protein [Thermodesulfobacteriota bacterium]
MKLIFRVCTIISIVLIMAGSIQAKSDRKGSSDYPLLSRMPDFWIAAYQESEHESHTFRDSANNKITIEGQKYFIEYRLKKGGQEPGRLMILKNYENALKQIDAEILKRTKKDVYSKVSKEGKEVWIQVHALDSLYRLTIVEREQMEQKVDVNPEALFGDIATTGHATVYGIYFDHDSANIKQESKPSLTAIADMLNANKSLKLYVVGHTDMTGGFKYNVGLSLKRANAVVKALVSEYGITAERLAGKGAGPLCPVGSNKNENGRKLNRRVELVEM